MQAPGDPDDYIEAEWDTDGKIKTIKNAHSLHKSRTTYEYQNGRITRAVLHNLNGNDQTGSIIYQYNPDGRVILMYDEADEDDNSRFEYANGKLKKVTRYVDGSIDTYWDVQTDENNNIVKAEEWLNEESDFTKQATYTFTRDTRKNPFKDLAVYMMHFDDASLIFNFWGANNFTNEVVKTYGFFAMEATAGFKYKYDASCHPVSSQQTLSGVVSVLTDSYQYTYY
jgi:hypothetical protein